MSTIAIKETQMPPLFQWEILSLYTMISLENSARVEEVITGKDGRVRGAVVQVNSGRNSTMLRRPYSDFILWKLVVTPNVKLTRRKRHRRDLKMSMLISTRKPLLILMAVSYM